MVNEEAVIILPDQSEVVITFLRIHAKGKIRLGIEAPHPLPVHRREVWERIKAKQSVGFVVEGSITHDATTAVDLV